MDLNNQEPVVVTPPTTDCEASASSGDEHISPASSQAIYRPVGAPPSLPTSIFHPTVQAAPISQPMLSQRWPSSGAAASSDRIALHQPLLEPQQQYPQERLGYFSPCAPVAKASVAAGEILDEAVEELFLQESLSTESDTIMDFVDTWYPGGNDEANIEDSIQSDVQLGYMLDKILGV